LMGSYKVIGRHVMFYNSSQKEKFI